MTLEDQVGILATVALGSVLCRVPCSQLGRGPAGWIFGLRFDSQPRGAAGVIGYGFLAVNGKTALTEKGSVIVLLVMRGRVEAISRVHWPIARGEKLGSGEEEAKRRAKKNMTKVRCRR